MKTDIQIKTSGTKGKLLLNGMDISECVTGYEIIHNAGTLPKIKVQLTGNLHMQGDMILKLPEPLCDFFERKKTPDESGADGNQSCK